MQAWRGAAAPHPWEARCSCQRRRPARRGGRWAWRACRGCRRRRPGGGARASAACRGGGRTWQRRPGAAAARHPRVERPSRRCALGPGVLQNWKRYAATTSRFLTLFPSSALLRRTVADGVGQRLRPRPWDPRLLSAPTPAPAAPTHGLLLPGPAPRRPARVAGPARWRRHARRRRWRRRHVVVFARHGRVDDGVAQLAAGRGGSHHRQRRRHHAPQVRLSWRALVHACLRLLCSAVRTVRLVGCGGTQNGEEIDDAPGSGFCPAGRSGRRRGGGGGGGVSGASAGVSGGEGGSSTLLFVGPALHPVYGIIDSDLNAGEGLDEFTVVDDDVRAPAVPGALASAPGRPANPG